MTKLESSVIIVLFGLPGSGKSLAGEILSRNFSFHSYHADSDYTAPMKSAMQENRPIPAEMRDEYYDIITQRTKQLQQLYPWIAVDHWFPIEKHRRFFLERIPQAKFVLLRTPPNIRIDRLINGGRQQPIEKTDPEYYVKVSKIFEPPLIPHLIVNNDGGRDDLTNKLRRLING